jgi:hypothetical protein
VEDGVHSLAVGDIVFSANEFQVLTENLGELLRWTRDARGQLSYYRQDSEPENAPID